MDIENQVIKKIPKGTILQRAGTRYPKVYSVKKGLLRSYTIDSKGKEHVFMFAPEDWIVSDINAIVNKAITPFFVDAVEDSEVIELPLNIDEQLENATPISYKEELFRILRRVSVLQQRVLMLMSESALYRYQHFLETYPNIVERAPQKMIASYLGITPQALSKIRSDWAKSKK